MTVDDVFRRVIKGHAVLILTCLLLPMAAAVAVQLNRPTDWVAAVRVQASTQAPTSTTQADGISSTVTAVVTTPSVVQKALDAAHVSADVQKFTKDHVSVTRLGESPIVEISVTDASRDAAAVIASTLAREATSFMNQGGGRADLKDALASVDQRIEQASAHRDRLTNRLGHAYSPNSREDLMVEIQSVDRTLTELDSERVQLVLAKTSKDGVVAINAMQPGVTKAPSGLLPTLALALVFGLIVGLSGAALTEMLRPRISGPRELATLLGVPLLGWSGERITDLARAAVFAARRLGVEVIVLLSADEKDSESVTELLEELSKSGQATIVGEARMTARISAAQGGGRPMRGTSVPAQNLSGTPVAAPQIAFMDVRFTSLQDITGSERGPEEMNAGVVVISRGRVLQRRFHVIQDILTSVRWPVVGVIDVPAEHH